jgi:hypothetical protein
LTIQEISLEYLQFCEKIAPIRGPEDWERMANGVQGDAVLLEGFRKGLQTPLVEGVINSPLPAKCPLPEASKIQRADLY